jgi:carbon storage regulator
MLVLTREQRESIVIGDDITVTVLEIRGDTVRLGIVAPPGVPVHREEVWEAIQEERRRAAARDHLKGQADE